MKEIKKEAEQFALFLNFSDDKFFTKEQLMKTGYFSCEEEMDVFFSLYDDEEGLYVSKVTFDKLLETELMEYMGLIN